MKIKLLILMFASVMANTFAQNWTVYDTGNSNLPNNFITAIGQDNANNLWVGSNNKVTQVGNGGLVKIEQNGTQTVYNTSNSQLLSNNIRGIACDGNNVWIATDKGLSQNIQGVWVNYTSVNSGLFCNEIYDVDVDNSGNVWLATWRGISMYNGTNWQFWIKENSSLTDNHIMDITIDDNGNIYASSLNTGVFKYNAGDWVSMQTGLTGYWDFNKVYQTLPTQTVLITAGFHGVGLYDGSNWTTIDSASTDFPDRTALSATILGDTLWITTKIGGVAKYDLINDVWNVLNTSNSQLPSNWGEVIFTDTQGNIVIGTDEGLVYLDYTVTSVNNIEEDNSFRIYPNPAQKYLTIDNISANVGEIKILDLTGKVVLIVNTQTHQGFKTLGELDISNLQNGIYLIKVGNNVQKLIKK